MACGAGVFIKIITMRHALIFEGIATFFLCLAASLSPSPIPVAAILCALIYMGGSISGAHYNPAVSVAMWFRGRSTTNRTLAYIGVQVGAALLAAILIGLYNGHSTERAKDLVEALGDSPFDGVVAGVTAEFLGTFLLAFVVLMVATSRHTAGNSYFGLAIALTILGAGGAFHLVNPSFNPAVKLSSVLEGFTGTLFTDDSSWRAFSQELAYFAHNFLATLTYIGSALLGGLAAAALFVKLFPEDR
jgi:aquaporin Z